MNMSHVALPSNFETVRRQFDFALDNGLRVLQKCADTETDRVGAFADQFFSKSLITALTIKLIINPPQRVGYPALPASFRLWDLPSLCVLSRCLLETYLIKFYLCVEDIPTEERDFRLLWWKWHERAERVRLSELYGSRDPHFDVERQERDSLHATIKAHPFFIRQPLERKKEIENKLKKQSALIAGRSTLATAAGINKGQFQQAYDYLSQFAHVLPLAESAVRSVKPDVHDGLEPLFLPTRWATAWLVFTVRDFVKVFPVGKDVITGEFWQLSDFYSDLLVADLSQIKEA